MKKTFADHVKDYLTPSLLIGAIIAGAYWGGEFIAVSKTVQFENPAQKEKTRAHIDSDYNEVRNYQLMQEVTGMKVELDTAYAFVNAMFKEDRAKRKLDSINSANAIISRAKRDSTVLNQAEEIKQIKREQQVTSNAVQLTLTKVDAILKKLDTIKQ